MAGRVSQHRPARQGGADQAGAHRTRWPTARERTIMTLLSGQQLPSLGRRTYHVEVPANPPLALIPAIIVFHGGGQDIDVIARNWGVSPSGPPPAPLDNYLLAFPESDPRMTSEWVHFQTGDTGFPTFDLEFVRDLITELTTRTYATGGAVGGVSANPEMIYVAGFSNGGGMVWQLLNSDLSTSLRGFAAVGKALDPEKVTHYNNTFPAGTAPAAAPVFYLQGTADRGFRPPSARMKGSWTRRCRSSPCGRCSPVMG